MELHFSLQGWHRCEVFLDSQPLPCCGNSSQENLHKIHLVRHLCAFLDQGAFQTVAHAHVTSWLEYYSALYIGLPLKATQKLQTVVTKAILHALTSLPRKLHWLIICFQVYFKRLAVTYKVLHDSACLFEGLPISYNIYLAN